VRESSSSPRSTIKITTCYQQITADRATMLHLLTSNWRQNNGADALSHVNCNRKDDQPFRTTSQTIARCVPSLASLGSFGHLCKCDCIAGQACVNSVSIGVLQQEQNVQSAAVDSSRDASSNQREPKQTGSNWPVTSRNDTHANRRPILPRHLFDDLDTICNAQ
jgi:hypothetical protein